MSDWAVGNLAVCVDARDNPTFRPTELVEGRVYRVIAVTPPARCSLYGNRLGVGLIVAGVICDCPEGYAHERFRKIRPDEHEGCADDWALILETTKQTVRA